MSRLAAALSDTSIHRMRPPSASAPPAISGRAAKPSPAIPRFTSGPTSDTTVEAPQPGRVRPNEVCPPMIESTIRSTGHPKSRAVPA